MSCLDVKSRSLPVMEPGRLTGAGEKPGRQPQSHGAAGGFLLKSFMARKGQYVSPYPPHGDRGPRRRWADRAGSGQRGREVVSGAHTSLLWRRPSAVSRDRPVAVGPATA